MSIEADDCQLKSGPRGPRCNQIRRAQGLAYPRTCEICGLGRCQVLSPNGPLPTYGAILRTARERLGWSLREASARHGCSPARLCQIENGQHNNPSVRTLVRLARAYGLDVMELVNAVMRSSSGRRKPKGA